MTRPEDSEGMRIGEVLKGARTRQGIEMAEVEERTKIRTKYLRALEAEDWEVLPNPAYAKGFLRTYAQLLGLDADAVVDEYRRQVESQLERTGPFGVGEPVLEGRRRPSDRPPGGLRPAWLIALGVVAAAVVFLVVGLISGDDGDERKRPQAQQAKKERAENAGGEEKEEPKPEEQPPATVVLGLSVTSDVQVCLLGADEQVLIASQVLNAGTEERFEQPRFILRFPTGYDRGQFDLALDGEPARLPELSGPAAFEIAPGQRPRVLDPPGTSCP